MATHTIIKTSIPEFLKDHVGIPLENQPSMCCLGTMGATDPLDFINLETHKIPFKQGNLDPSKWSGTFSSWPILEPRWRDWYNRVCKAHSGFWES
ncbi:hypothetical protein PVAP13_1NG215847 [Panicum virgatum]|uniref:Uncharacterized protein n=1 Tax=Panicum virgatum TaxID=38727 RepID=A0A8T0X134_PANVG|nr:hypothetical protein PVAP13_1NG215847 [Panicum virgatum]